jgi:hypothetical protein
MANIFHNAQAGNTMCHHVAKLNCPRHHPSSLPLGEDTSRGWVKLMSTLHGLVACNEWRRAANGGTDEVV